MHPIALNIRCVHHSFSANGWQQRSWDGKKKKNTLSWSEATITTGTTSICTRTWTSHHRDKRERKKEHAFQTNITAIWAKIWSKRVHPFRRKEKKNGPKDTLPFATVVVNVRAKSSKERGVQLLFWASEQLGALAYGRRGSTVTALSSHVKSHIFLLFFCLHPVNKNISQVWWRAHWITAVRSMHCPFVEVLSYYRFGSLEELGLFTAGIQRSFRAQDHSARWGSLPASLSPSMAGHCQWSGWARMKVQSYFPRRTHIGFSLSFHLCSDGLEWTTD